MIGRLLAAVRRAAADPYVQAGVGLIVASFGLQAIAIQLAEMSEELTAAALARLDAPAAPAAAGRGDLEEDLVFLDEGDG